MNSLCVMYNLQTFKNWIETFFFKTSGIFLTFSLDFFPKMDKRCVPLCNCVGILAISRCRRIISMLFQCTKKPKNYWKNTLRFVISTFVGVFYREIVMGTYLPLLRNKVPTLGSLISIGAKPESPNIFRKLIT